MFLSKLFFGLSIAAFAEAAEILDPLSDTLGNVNILGDMGESLLSAMTDIPTISDMGDMLNFSAGSAEGQPQQPTPGQQDHVELAESFFLSPFGASLADMMALPRLASELSSRSSTSGISNLRGKAATAAAKAEGFIPPMGPMFNPLNLLQLKQYQTEMLQQMLQQKQDALSGATRSASKEEELLSAAALAQLLNPTTLLQLKEKQGQMMQEMLQQKQNPKEQRELERQKEQKVEALAEELERQAEQQQEEQQQQQLEQQQSEQKQLEEAAEADILADEYGYDASEGQQEVPAAAEADVAAAAEAEVAAAAEENQEEEKSGSPQRFFLSRTNPLGPLQPAVDSLALFNWAISNPLAMIEFKADSFKRCMSLMQDANACAKALKVDPYIVSHGGINSAFRPFALNQ